MAPRVLYFTMYQQLLSYLGWSKPDAYRPTKSLVLVNGLAEQGESWYPNRRVWQQQFDVHTPGVIVYGGDVMQERLAARKPINIAFLTDRLADYLDQYVQSPPYHLVASSLGGQISVEYAARYPDKVGKIVLLCPSGLGTEERLPITEGARHKNYQGLVESTFHDRRFASPRIVQYYAKKFACKRWRKAFFETVRGTKSHSVRDKLKLIERPTLVVCGREDRIVDPLAVKEAVKEIPNHRFLMIPNCGHAPQLECSRLINRLVSEFLNLAEPIAPKRSTADSLQIGLQGG
ncbi:alpha/beta fold hydrolase [Anatilimnocola floriformis]|uniref:alpha/beta fold hydrolase n=1 Tax=Anatilimnocola floriformis TaxID=2948575 RepID=UPI0020C420D2|nr:alpha/beta hydrolase [Anatilimnocola floriformis]